MKIDKHILMEVLLTSFDCGYTGGMQCDEAIANILEKYKIYKSDEPAKDNEPRIYKAEELQKFPAGTSFIHSVLGKCAIYGQPDEKEHFMVFENYGLMPAGLEFDTYPWNLPMTLINYKENNGK